MKIACSKENHATCVFFYIKQWFRRRYECSTAQKRLESSELDVLSQRKFISSHIPEVQYSESRKSQTFSLAVTSLLTTFLIIQPQWEVPHVAHPFSPWQSTSSTCIAIFLKGDFFKLLVPSSKLA